MATPAKWEYYRIVEPIDRVDEHDVIGAITDDHVQKIEDMANGGWELVLAQPGQEPIVGAQGETASVMVLLFRKQRG